MWFGVGFRVQVVQGFGNVMVGSCQSSLVKLYLGLRV